ncbi:glycosyltransferase [Candidatus Daviesbacteria bacterium]|nr:glycosyltransferase [Candidatus Daviesbacteria bacterium]
MKNLSVFFPLYNEKENVEATVKKAVEVLQKLKLEYEIILVNDGSSDGTGEVIDRFSKQNKKIRAIHHAKNLGYGEALKSGFYNAKYELIVYTDGDGQFDFSEITKFLKEIEQHDLVIGYRIKRRDPFFRILFKKGWQLSLFIFFRLTLKDIDCGFKIIKRQVLEKIGHLDSTRGAMINAELVIKAKKNGFKIGQVGVNHYPRNFGKPTGASLKVIIKSYLDLIRLWWKLKTERKYFVVICLILLLAIFLRLYKIDEYMTFLGDEGRDGLIVKDMLVNYNFPLIGPPTSVGNIYLGPLYYYMMAVVMFIFSLNPVAAAGMDAIIGVATVALIYYLGKIWFGKPAGLIASFLYAISPVTIIYSRSSWNPNPTPFFSTVAIWSFYQAHISGNFRWLILTGASLAAALQMHYLALILLPTFALFWIFEVIFRTKPIKNLISGTVFGILTFILVMSPLIWFDFRHNFLNYRAISELLTQGSAIKGNILLNILKIPSIYSRDLIGRYLAGENLYLTLIISALIILSLARLSWVIFYLAVWLGVGLLGLSFYQGAIYDHYLGFLNPAPFLLLGSLVSKNFGKFKNWALSGLFILTIVLMIVNLQKNPLNYPPNNQLKRTQNVAKFIIEKAAGEDFNFALIARNNYDAAYQFYLEQYGYKPKQVPFEKTNQLLVVCEDQICDPTHNAKYEVAAFGMSKIDWMEEFFGFKIYKLVPNPSGKP